MFNKDTIRGVKWVTALTYFNSKCVNWVQKYKEITCSNFYDDMNEYTRILSKSSSLPPLAIAQKSEHSASDLDACPVALPSEGGRVVVAHALPSDIVAGPGVPAGVAVPSPGGSSGGGGLLGKRPVPLGGAAVGPGRPKKGRPSSLPGSAMLGGSVMLGGVMAAGIPAAAPRYYDVMPCREGYLVHYPFAPGLVTLATPPRVEYPQRDLLRPVLAYTLLVAPPPAAPLATPLPCAITLHEAVDLPPSVCVDALDRQCRQGHLRFGATSLGSFALLLPSAMEDQPIRDLLPPSPPCLHHHSLDPPPAPLSGGVGDPGCGELLPLSAVAYRDPLSRWLSLTGRSEATVTIVELLPPPGVLSAQQPLQHHLSPP